jgi:CubicO group peptidase (beta-lactamase class C family)
MAALPYPHDVVTTIAAPAATSLARKPRRGEDWPQQKKIWGAGIMQDGSGIDQALRERADAAAIPGAVAIAATSNDIVYQGTFGKRDLSKDEAMTPDSVFWIASMTKAITATAAMQLVEQGKLDLEAPIGTVLPDLASPMVLEGFDARGESKLRPARTAITLRHLLTHTAGFAYDMWNGDLLQYVGKMNVPAARTGLNASLRVPLMTDPGTRWEYGINIDWAGKAVEAASGTRLHKYLHDHIFAPLGMANTSHRISDWQRQRLVGLHARQSDGSLVPRAFETEQNPEFYPGGGGLYSIAGDYIKFCQMILNRGHGNGHQVLKPETVALMAQNHIDNLNMTRMTAHVPSLTNDVDFYPDIDKKWGLSFLINTAKTPEGRSPGSLSWAGLGNTYYWIDPARDITGVILMQVLPFADPECLSAFAAFESGVYAGLDATQRAA